jgi:PAS domain S-box-containing protein
MAQPRPADSLPLLATVPLEPHARRLALLVVLASLAVFIAVIPFAKVQLAPVNAFIPIYESALLLNDLITAVMLFGHFSILRSRALLVLACGYLFAAVIVIPHALTFPGVFAPTGLLGAGAQSTAWLYVLWHSGFPLFVMAYALLNHRDHARPCLIGSPRRAAVAGVAAVLVLAGACTVLATTFHDALPAILISGKYTLAGNAILASTWLFSALAIAVLWRYTKRSTLDVWLLVVMSAWICDIALSAVLNGGRFDVGFYAGRIFGLLAASCVLIVLLLESNRLFAQLAVAHDDALQRTQDLQRLNTQNEERAAQYARALGALHYKEEEVRAVVQNIADCVITIDARGVVKSANPAVAQVFGYSESEVLGRDILMLIPELEYDAHFFLRGSLDHATGQAMAGSSTEVEGLHRDGRRVPLELAISDFEVHGERLFIGVLRDISERKRFIAELWQARAHAEHANKAKSAFLSSMSHELRTPLNAILGFAQVLTSDSMPVTADKRKHFTTHILKAGKHLLVLINEILDLAKVESGTLALSPEPVGVADVIGACQAMMEPMAAQRGIRLVFAVDSGWHVRADRTRLKQVLLNLMSNAVKYNRPGGAVTVGCAAVSAERVRITVQDDGAGLDAAQLEQLFQPFNRLGQEAGGEEGTGIGLTVTKRLVELMGGSIGATSTVGVGSVFTIEMKSAAPAQHPETTDFARAMAPARSGLAVPVRTLLYVEDNPANQALVQEILAFRSGLRLLTAADARLGLDMARAHLPDVILMDINLPGMSGDEAMAILRADPDTAHIPVIALSANAMPRDVARSMASGFFRYLTKPIDIDEFFAALAGALEAVEDKTLQQR